jgi:hypothetical protein
MDKQNGVHVWQRAPAVRCSPRRFRFYQFDHPDRLSLPTVSRCPLSSDAACLPLLPESRRLRLSDPPSSDAAAGMCAANSLPGWNEQHALSGRRRSSALRELGLWMASRMRAPRSRSADGGRQSGTVSISDSSAAEPGGDFASAVLSVTESPCSSLIGAFHSLYGFLRADLNVAEKERQKNHFFNGIPAERPLARETQFHSAQTPAQRFITAHYFPSRPRTIKFTRDRIMRDPGRP